MLCQRPFAILLQLALSAEAEVRLALIYQALGMYPVNGKAIGLAIRRMRSAQIRTFIPVQTEPLEVGDELIVETGFTAFDIRVLDARHHGSAVPAREEPVEQGGTCIADMEMPGGRGSKTNPDDRTGSH